MRMWMIDPKLLCRKHLLGEHGEIHKHKHNFENGHSIENRVKYPAQIIPCRMQERHNELAEEMKRRGYNHNSPYEIPDLSSYPTTQIYPTWNLVHNIKDLTNRCDECKKLIENEIY